MLATARVLGYLLVLVAGAAAGLLGSFRHAYTDGWVPVGLLIALCLSFAVFVTAGLLFRSRGAAAVAALGWLAAVVVLSMVRPEGDLVVPATTLGTCWLLLGTLVAGLALGLPYSAVSTSPFRQREPSDVPAGESSGVAPTGR